MAESSVINKNNNNLSVKHAEDLLHGLNELRSAQKLIDVTLIVEDKKFQAHRVVLAACSDYFSVMFNTFSEANQSEIHLKGVTAKGFELLLDYAYTSQLELTVNNVQDVLAASTHVQMNAITAACANFLASQIELDNFILIADLAEFFSLELLKKKVYRFICSQLSELCYSAEFPKLFTEQFEYILSSNCPVNCTELRVLEITLKHCQEKSLTPHVIQRLFKHIRWHQITDMDLLSILDAIEHGRYTKILGIELRKQVYKRLEKRQDDDSDNECETEDIISPEVLINSRGMELALVNVGGFERNGLTNNINCYLPSKGKWELLTFIPHIEQSNYGTAVLGNNLFVVGGSYDVCLKEYIHPFGFRYCASTNKWSTIAPIEIERCRFSLNAMGNRYLYAVGGVNEFDENEFNACDLSYCERYDATTDSWETVQSLIENRSQHAGVVVEDKLYISGGINRHMVLSTLWCFDTKTMEWHNLSSMPTPRADHSLIALGRKIYACGGWYEDTVSELRVLANTIDVYDIDTDEWKTEVENPMPTFYAGITAVRRRIYFIGGLLSNATINRTSSLVHCYDVDAQKWIRLKEWQYTQEIWESSCVALYIPQIMSKTDNVRVAVRVRPLSREEDERGYQVVVQRTPDSEQVVVNNSELFTFNRVFGIDSTQKDVYNKAVVEMLDCLFEGFNATILAYGQTGSGKTHTMGTACDGEINEDAGVIPRALEDIFSRIAEYQDKCEFVVSCSFLELYQEQLYDLLSDKSRENSIVDLREDRTGIIIPGLTEEIVRTTSAATQCLVRGSGRRAVASTAMNKHSSRSHAIFTLTLQSTEISEKRTVTISKFHLVDLAGSERSNKTQATGERFKEGVKINQGLLALGNVISALGSGQGFVRYRDSKLTRLLQDSLGGNSVTLMIACVSPADFNMAETISTLRYADRARKIKNKPIVNQDPHAAEINHYKSIIQKLRLELLTLRGNNNNNVLKDTALYDDLEALALPAVEAAELNATQAQNKVQDSEFIEKYCRLQLQLQAALNDVAENEMRAHIAEAAHEKLRNKTQEIKKHIINLSNELTHDTALTKHATSIQQIQQLVLNLDEEFERTQCELNEHKLSSTISNSTMSEDANDKSKVSEDVRALMREQTDAFTMQQMNFNEELQRINRELNLKEQLQQRVMGNMTKLSSLDTLENMEEKFRECEAKIADLEAEKSELLEKLRHHSKESISAKLAEERRRRLQALENEIQEMKKRNLQQAKLLKVREKEAAKIKNLCSEIQAMKESKVKLIRSMRQESENFRQWKLTREKELMQLRNIDRKRQNEMARKEALHTKQRNVLKRKCEEAMAVNKRLKDVLDRQKVAQSARVKLQLTKDSSKLEQILTAIDHELEVIITQIDAEHTLEQLMDDRGIISARIKELRIQQEQQQQQLERPDATQAESVLQATAELNTLEEELEMRNAQIADLQQKVCVTELEARQQSLCESINSVSEGRAALKKLLSKLIALQREHIQLLLEQRNATEEQRALRETSDERYNAAMKRMRLMKLEFDETLSSRENTYEEKISVLLRELHSRAQQSSEEVTPEQQERMRIESEQLDKFEKMREELEHYKNLVNQLRAKDTRPMRRTVLLSQMKHKAIKEEFMYPTDVAMDDHPSDPDWEKTPFIKKRRRTNLKTRGSNASLSSSSSIEESFDTAQTSNAAKDIKAQDSQHTVAELECTCRGKCLTKRCKCVLYGMNCDVDKCRCSKYCVNGKAKLNDVSKNGMDEEESKTELINSLDMDEDKENQTNNKTTLQVSDTFVSPPKNTFNTRLTFNTPSIKGNFFK